MRLGRLSLGHMSVAMVLTLSACGGSTEVSPPDYDNLSSTEAGVSTLAGTAGRTNPDTDAVGLQTTSGTVDHSTGALSLTDDQFTFTDADGPDADPNVGYVNGSDSLTQISTTLISQTYDFVLPYQQTYTNPADGKTYLSAGVLGIVTSAGDVPASGSATYTGQGAVFVKDGANLAQLGSTNSTVAANFGSGTVDVTLSGISGSHGSTQVFDEITATGMIISGNGFTGGTIDVTNGGTSVLSIITGGGQSTSGGGHFFGYDAALGGPDEAAGTLTADGVNGSVIAVFATD